MTDDSIMPIGKYKGEKMANVPPEYLLWLYENSFATGIDWLIKKLTQ